MRLTRRRAWTWIVTAVATLIVLAATLSGLFEAAVWLVPSYRTRLEDALTRRSGHPASVGAIELRWRGLEPVIELDDVSLRSSDGSAVVLTAARLQIGFAPSRLMVGDARPDDFAIYGMALGAQLDAAGKWSVSGFELKPNRPHFDLLGELSKVSRLRIQASQLTIADARLDSPPMLLDISDARLDRHGGERRIQLRLRPPAAIARGLTADAVIAGDLSQPAQWKGHWNAAVEDFGGWPWLAPLLAADTRIELRETVLKASGDFAEGQMSGNQFSVQAGSIEAQRGGTPIAHVQALAARGRLAHEHAGSWHLLLDSLQMNGARGQWPDAHVDLRVDTAQQAAAPAQAGMDAVSPPQADGPTGADAAHTLNLDASFLRVDDLAPWFAVFKAAPSLDGFGMLAGDFLDAHLSMQLAPGTPASFTLGTGFSALAASSAKTGSEFSGLAGSLSATADHAHIELHESPLKLVLPAVFEQPLSLDSVSTAVDITREAEGTTIRTPEFSAAAGSTRLGGDAELIWPKNTTQSPSLRLHAHFVSDDLVALKPYMPLRWNEHTRDWLNRALQGGRVTQGNVIFEGEFADFPFVEHPNGRWNVAVEFADSKLAFAPDWPAAEALKGTLKIGGHTLDVHLDAGRIDQVPVQSMSGQIADFREAQLLLDATAAGDAADAYALLRQSPLSARLAGLLNHSEAKGPMQVQLHIQSILKGEKPPVHANGTVQLGGDQIAVNGLDAPFTDVRGAVDFSAAGARGSGLTAHFRDATMAADIIGDPASPEGLLQARFDCAVGAPEGSIMATYIPGFIRTRLTGTASWLLGLPFSGVNAGHVFLSSDLHGMESRLPPPLAKRADDRLPLAIELHSDASVPLSLNIESGQSGDQAKMALRFASQDGHLVARAAAARLGPGEMPVASNEGLFVEGTPDRLDLVGWLGFIATLNAHDDSAAANANDRSGPATSLAFQRIDMTPGMIDARDFAFPGVHLHAAPSASGVDAHLSGDGAQGTVAWSPAEGGRVTAHFDHLHAAQITPSAPGVPAHSLAVPDDPFDPAKAPIVDLVSDAVRLGDADLGRLDFATSRIANGLALDRATISGGVFELDAHGAWRRTQGQSSADLNFTLGSTDIAAVLQAAGYARSITAKQSHFTAKLAWPDAASGIDLPQASGDLNIEMENGALNIVNPGAGRILGLLNLYALPRRLTQGFSDVTDKGFAFDKIDGQFDIGDGNAVTPDVEIVGPSATMRIRGRVGLAARDYDQDVRIRPKVSTTLTVGAALLGGPVGAGIALVAQELFGEPLNRLSEFSYHITGSWDNPQIKRGGEVPAQPASSLPAPAAPAEEP